VYEQKPQLVRQHINNSYQQFLATVQIVHKNVGDFARLTFSNLAGAGLDLREKYWTCIGFMQSKSNNTALT